MIFSKNKIFEILSMNKEKINDFFIIDEKTLEYSRNIFNFRIKEEYNEWEKNFKFLKENIKYYNLFKNKDDFNIENENFKKIFDNLISKYLSLEKGKSESTRKSGGIILENLMSNFENFIGGSADLAESNCVINKFSKIIHKDDYSGNYIHFGIREHAASAICNGIACYNQNYIPFFSTFLIFSDYAKPGIRLSALMKLQIFIILTHDSIFLGEDGPTHQPIEQIGSLRLIPNLLVFRPADFFESMISYQIALLKKSNPSVFSLSRQNLPQTKDIGSLNDQKYLDFSNFKNGAYEIFNIGLEHEKKIIIFASGSEVSTAIEVAQKLYIKNNILNIKVISVFCLNLFFQSNNIVLESIIENNNSNIISRVIIEASNCNLWYKHINKDVLFIGTGDRFGLSAKESDIRNFFELNPEKICQKIFKFIEDVQKNL